MTQEQKIRLMHKLKDIGLPRTFAGDRLDAFNLGLEATLQAVDEVLKDGKKDGASEA